MWQLGVSLCARWARGWGRRNAELQRRNVSPYGLANPPYAPLPYDNLHNNNLQNNKDDPPQFRHSARVAKMQREKIMVLVAVCNVPGAAKVSLTFCEKDKVGWQSQHQGDLKPLFPKSRRNGGTIAQWMAVIRLPMALPRYTGLLEPSGKTFHVVR